MRYRLFKGAIILVTVFATGLFAGTLTKAVFYMPEDEIVPPVLPPTLATSSEPVRVMIPTLDIDARVEKVGVNGRGEMGIPRNFTNVAWYKYGPSPGQLGSAVVAGHVDNGLALPGVFKNLGKLRPGDNVYVKDRSGDILHFVVEEIAYYPYTDSPAEHIFARKDAAWLNLVTCSGQWISKDRTYSERLVVYTKFVGIVESVP